MLGQRLYLVSNERMRDLILIRSSLRRDQHHSTQSESRWGYSLVSPVSRGKDHAKVLIFQITSSIAVPKCGQNCSSLSQAYPGIGTWPAWMDKN